MVEKNELAVIFGKEKISETVEQFIPLKVVEGLYNAEENMFEDKKDGIMYMHMSISAPHVAGYAYRTSIEIIKNNISEAKTEQIEKIKQEMFSYVNQFTYRRDTSVNECIVVTNKENGNEYLFEDKDNNQSVKPQKKSSSNYEPVDTIDMTPYELETEVKKTIKGQDEAVRKIVTALWTTMNFREMKKKNMLIIGPSGVGKTAIFEKIKTILNIPVIIFSVPGLSQAGYVGRSTDEILKQIYYEADSNIDVAEKSIVILDEIDKIASNDARDLNVSTTGVQNELLKIIEGCQRFIETNDPMESSFTIDTSEIIFIGTGAFQELYEKPKPPIGYNQQVKNVKENTKIDTEKLIKYGLKRELIGRMPIKVELNKLGKAELKEIITSSDESELNATINALRILKVKIENIDEVIDLVVEDALGKGIGARGLIDTINNIFQEIFYEVGNNPNKYKSVIIGKNIINDNKDFQLVPRRNYTKKRVK